MCRLMCLLYRVIQDFVKKKTLFSEIQAIRVGGVTMYDEG